jgi:predicted alpha/beta-hydrolase family hydrolase
MDARRLAIEVGAGTAVSALALAPPDAFAGFVFAHGAGAGMAHPFMEAVARELAQRGVATLRYQFPYMESGGRRPDPPAVAHAAVRAAVAQAACEWPGLTLAAGGKSFGARMTSQAQAKTALPGVQALLFVGFPLHPAGKPGIERAEHLAQVQVPMLFLQGTRDTLADAALVRQVVDGLGAKATLEWVEGADHSFHLPARAGRSDAHARAAMLDAAVSWLHRVAGR